MTSLPVPWYEPQTKSIGRHSKTTQIPSYASDLPRNSYSGNDHHWTGTAANSVDVPSSTPRATTSAAAATATSSSATTSTTRRQRRTTWRWSFHHQEEDLNMCSQYYPNSSSSSNSRSVGAMEDYKEKNQTCTLETGRRCTTGYTNGTSLCIQTWTKRPCVHCYSAWP